MSRKTISVISLINRTNEICKNSQANAVDVRQGAMTLLESVLHDTGSYKGFRYLLSSEIQDGSPGVNYLNGQPDPDLTQRFANTDRTRVQYYT